MAYKINQRVVVFGHLDGTVISLPQRGPYSGTYYWICLDNGSKEKFHEEVLISMKNPVGTDC